MLLVSRKRSRPARADITDQVTSIDEQAGLDGAPTLTVTISDPEWLVTNLELLDLDVDGRLDHVETKIDDAWYRLVKVSPNDDTLSLVFEDRTVSILRQYTKPKKRRRVSGYTRAMFLRDLVAEARKDGHDIEFVCPRLTQAQRVKHGKKIKHDPTGDGTRGFSKNAKLTVKGERANKKQKKIATTALDIADQVLGAADAGGGIRFRVYVALMEALITESSITNLEGGDRDSAGVLQVRRGVHTDVNPRDVEQVVTLFLTKGYSGRGGAVSLATQTTKKPHEIAQAVQGSAFADGSNYKEHEAEAKEWVKAFHLITDESELTQDVTFDKAYYFTRGESGSTEDSWQAMTRLAGEVNWRVFVRGNKVLYMPDSDLYKQAPRFELSRQSPRVTSVSYDWDQGKKVAEATLNVLRQDVVHGSTVEIADAGPASTRWLVWNVHKYRDDGYSELTLRSPSAALPEPAAERETTSASTDASGLKSDTMKVLIRKMKSVDKNTPGYTYGGGHGQKLDDLPPSTRFDCSSSVSWVLHKAGLFDHDVAWVSGDFAAKYGRPGVGKFFTVWASDDHVWIQIHKGEYAGGRFDTGGPGGGMGARLWTKALPRSTAGFTPRHAEGY
jgi:hypothetical protein